MTKVMFGILLFVCVLGFVGISIVLFCCVRAFSMYDKKIEDEEQEKHFNKGTEK